MNIEEMVVQEVHILLPKGRIDSLTAEAFEQTLEIVFSRSIKQLLIDFSQTDFISSAGLRVLLMTAKRSNKQGCKLRLCGMNSILQDVFDVSGFSSLFAVDRLQSDSLAQFVNQSD